MNLKWSDSESKLSLNDDALKILMEQNPLHKKIERC